MAALTRFEPMDQMFPEFLRRFGWSMRRPDDVPGDIQLDVTERDREYEVRASIPGAKKEDIRVNVDGNFISITAEVKKDKEEKAGGRVVLRETYVGSASRSFTLEHEIDAKDVVAKLEDGVLKLTLPKREGGKSKAIQIQ